MFHSLLIKRIFAIEPRQENIVPVLDTISMMMEDPYLGIEWGGIFNNNWGDRFPYTPKAKFWVAHNDTALFLKFEVQEQVIKAQANQNCGAIIEDSAVGFMISFDDRGYYSFDLSCIGKKSIQFTNNQAKVTLPTNPILDRVHCVSSLGDQCFDERTGDTTWSMIVAIPIEVFFEHDFESLEGLYAQVNVSKRGDGLSKPHYLSWSPIRSQEPNFNLPQYFGRMKFM